jgi:hypothetical protein
VRERSSGWFRSHSTTSLPGSSAGAPQAADAPTMDGVAQPGPWGAHPPSLGSQPAAVLVTRQRGQDGCLVTGSRRGWGLWGQRGSRREGVEIRGKKA